MLKTLSKLYGFEITRADNGWFAITSKRGTVQVFDLQVSPPGDFDEFCQEYNETSVDIYERACADYELICSILSPQELVSLRLFLMR